MSTQQKQLVAWFWAVTKTCILSFISLVGGFIVLTSFAYFPPQFDFGFLIGRQSYFYSWYAVAFYTHVISSPIVLFLGVAQSIDWLRNRSRRVHRTFGYVYTIAVLLFAAPSGLAMSIKASGGVSAATAFALLAISTSVATWQGFRWARRGDFVKHQQWMTRSYLLICSAVLLRFFAAVAARFELDFLTYGEMAWLSWLPSLLIYEAILRWKRLINHGMA